MSQDLVTVKEAAQLLGTSKEKVARLVKQGVLTSRPSVLDARRRLIPRMEIERILESEGRHAPVDTDAGAPPRLRTAGIDTEPLEVQRDEVEDDVRDVSTPVPSSIGVISDPAFQSAEAEEYMRRHRSSDWC